VVILSGARCRLVYAQLMPPPLTVSCFSKIQIGFTFLVPAHPGSPGKRAVKRVCVCDAIKITVQSVVLPHCCYLNYSALLCVLYFCIVCHL